MSACYFIFMQLQSKIKLIRKHRKQRVARIRKWDVNKQLDFQNNIESSKLIELSDKLENLPHERINPNIIDSLTGDLCNILITSARKTLGSNSGKNHKEKQFLSKPWFDLDCKFARKYF